MEFLADYGMFLAKLLTLLLAVLVVIAAITGRMQQRRVETPTPGNLEVRRLNDDYERAALTIKSAMLSKKAIKAERKAIKERRKKRSRSYDQIWCMS